MYIICFFFKQKTAYEMRISDWSSDVCSSDLLFPQQSVSKLWVAMSVLDAVDDGRISLDQKVRVGPEDLVVFHQPLAARVRSEGVVTMSVRDLIETAITHSDNLANDSLLRSEEHTSELQSLMRSSYAVFCLKKKTNNI